MEDNALLKAAEAAHRRFAAGPGLEYLRSVIADQHNYPFGKLLRIEVVGAGDGWAELTAQPDFQFYNPMMRIHGGWLAAVMDSCLGSAVITKLPDGSGAGTVQLSVNYVQKVTVESGLLRARGEVRHAGRSMLTASAEVRDAQGRLCVHGTGTFLIYQKS